MKYNGNINYLKCLEFGLNLSQGAVMDLIGHLPTWAEGKEIEGKIYYYLSTSKMIKELPIISEKRGTFLKILQVLKEKGLLNHKLLGNKGWYNLTEKGKSFFTKIFDEKYQEEQEKQGVENFTHSNESVEKNTHKCVKKYTQGVEKNTHNNNTSNNNTEYNIIINNTENKFSENSEKEKIEKNLKDTEINSVGQKNFSDYEILEKENFQENTELSDLESKKNPAPAAEKSVEIVKKEITENIDNLIIELKNLCNEVGVAYDGTQERNFAKHILTAKEFGRFCENINQTRTEFSKNILKASIQINFWKICSGPKLIYKNYAEVYNKAFLLKNNGRLGQIRQQSKVLTI